MKIKVFNFEGVAKIQATIQAWVNENPDIKIEYVTQSEGTIHRFITVIVFYTIQ